MGDSVNLNTKNMKKLLIHFKTAGYCSMTIEVPDDYQVPSTHPVTFWKDLRKRFRKEIQTDIMKCKTFGVEDQDLGGFYIDNMALDCIQRIYIYQKGEEDIRINLDHISLDK